MAENKKSEESTDNAAQQNDGSTPPETEELTDIAPPEETADPVPDLTEALDAAKQEAKENYDKLLRLSAEMENYKKRTAKELGDFRKYANESVMRDLLEVVDNLERALEASDTEAGAESLGEGIQLILDDLLKMFDRFAVKPIDALGEPFDPVFHQAVMQEETGEQPENTVLRQLQKGYTLHDRLLRPAMVVVAKAGVEPSGDTQTD